MTNEMTDEEQTKLLCDVRQLDEYRLANLKFTPDVIYDIGADIGSVTLAAHELYPNAKIVAVEPNPWSYPRLVDNTAEISEVISLHAALGQGQMYEPPSCPGPLHWMVVGKDAPTWRENLVPCDVPSIMLNELHTKYGGKQYVVKMDCESGEIASLFHEPSCQMIIDSAYFSAELHIWATKGDNVPKVANIVWQFLFRLAQTHTIYTYGYGVCLHVWALRRIDGSVVEF